VTARNRLKFMDTNTENDQTGATSRRSSPLPCPVIACWLTLGLLSVHFFTNWKIGEAAHGLSFLLCMSAIFSDVIFDTCARIFSPNK
jgi:hypothetical protein